MRAKKNTITLNGRVYDSKTGKPADDAVTIKVVTPQKSALKENIAKSTVHKIPVRTSADRKPGTKAATIHSRTERATTLSRATVKKPTPVKHPKAVAGVASQPTRIVVHSKGSQSPKAEPTIIRSSRIAKFNHAPVSVVHKANVPLVPAPKQQTARSTVRKAYDIADTPPAAHHKSPGKAVAHHTPKSTNIFETALQSATSHKTTHIATAKRRRLGKLSIAGMSVLILGLFFTYQNAPRIALYRAQSTIGFEASVPGYQPAGFRRIGPVQYQKGIVVINFQSNSDDRQYTVTQTATALDNSNLANTYLKSSGKQFETTSINGNTIYIYENSRATWINQGVWYTIDGNAHLGKDQLTNIIASI